MASEKDRYKLPDWIGPPPRGTHLDVLKGPKLIQKLLVDEKGHYYFGRNPTDCDFVCEHASCSRVHAVLLYHKLIKRFAIVDLESSHGTFVDNVRISALAPVFLNVDQSFHFGASTRRYFLREKLINGRGGDEFEDDVEIESGFSMAQADLDNSTESNTVQNRRIPPIPQTLDEARRKMRHRPRVKFNDEEEVINPEDIDPSVGRFRNMVRTAVIPAAANKRQHDEAEDQLFDFYSPNQPKKKAKVASPATAANGTDRGMLGSFASSTLGSLSLNAAPDLELYKPTLPAPKAPAAATAPQKYGPTTPMGAKQMLGVGTAAPFQTNDAYECPSKKKYAKEAWPKDMRPRSSSGVL